MALSVNSAPGGHWLGARGTCTPAWLHQGAGVDALGEVVEVKMSLLNGDPVLFRALLLSTFLDGHGDTQVRERGSLMVGLRLMPDS